LDAEFGNAYNDLGVCLMNQLFMSDQSEKALELFPSWEENRVSCALGLLNVQAFSGLEPSHIVLGEIVDPASGKSFKAATQLTPRDAELVAKVATSDSSDQKRLDAKLQWLGAFPQLRKKLKKAVAEHNSLLDEPELLVRNNIFTFPEPVGKSIPYLPNITQMLEHGRQGCLPFQATDKDCGSSCIPYFYWPEIQQLCQGQEGLRPPRYDVDTKCHLLSMGDPYLRIGPFLLENKNTEGNYIAQIHNIVSPVEMEAIKEKTQARLKATPYAVGGKNLDFSYDRTSKVHYLSERTDKLTRRLTKRLELSMAYNMYLSDRPHTSENYQIMNYGIGGKISLHLDTNTGQQGWDWWREVHNGNALSLDSGGRGENNLSKTSALGQTRGGQSSLLAPQEN